jgi:hypothetical protein
MSETDAIEILCNLGIKRRDAELRVRRAGWCGDTAQLVRICLTGQNLTGGTQNLSGRRDMPSGKCTPVLEMPKERLPVRSRVCATAGLPPAIESKRAGSATGARPIQLRVKQPRKWAEIISALDSIGVSPDIVRDCFKHYLCSIDKGV